jgi:hypothetical protein
MTLVYDIVPIVTQVVANISEQPAATNGNIVKRIQNVSKEDTPLNYTGVGTKATLCRFEIFAVGVGEDSCRAVFPKDFFARGPLLASKNNYGSSPL